MYGTEGDSRSHILSNDKHNVMERMGEDWFLAFEGESLGLICGTTTQEQEQLGFVTQ
jgi:hypothetical protein